VYGIETPTGASTLLNGHASYTFATGKTAHAVTLRVDNAADELYRNHLSYIKDLAPERGRSLAALYTVQF
jgi:iron complex outermembrane receptor protein